jgi:non-specific serine/threonine protein kinase
MAEAQPRSFGDLLKGYRAEAKISQEQLAELAGLSTNAISTLERGTRRAPYHKTVELLADAFRLSNAAREELRAAAERARPRSARWLDESDVSAGNLPHKLSSFVGSEGELVALQEQLAIHRLVTITGSGGVGKTRIALELGARLSGRGVGGAWFVDLAPLRDGAFVENEIASVLQLSLSSRIDFFKALEHRLGQKRVLLIVDNCEHLLPAASSAILTILRACPGVEIVATSRERLRVAGEVVYRLPSLPLPSGPVLTAADARSYAALELFAERAAAAEHRFVLSDDRVEAVAEICRRLDGIALAIELAAARIPSLGLVQLRSRLLTHFTIVSGGSRDLPPHQRTLLATIAWSYDLLAADESAFFRELAVFSGGWTLEAAEAISVLDDGPGNILELLSSLVDKSLVTVDLESETTRYSFFESTRAFALGKLHDSGEWAGVSRRHAEWLANFAERADETFLATPRREWLGVVGLERDNARAALEWALGPGDDAVLAGRISGGLRWLWRSAGMSVECLTWLEGALARLDSERYPAIEARLLRAKAGSVDGTAKVAAAKSAIELYERLGDRRGLAIACVTLSYGLMQINMLDEAQAAVNRALTLYREDGRQYSLSYALALGDRAAMFRFQGLLNEARSDLTESLQILSVFQDDWMMPHLQGVLSEIEFDAGNTSRALELASDALEGARQIRDARNEMYFLCNISCYHLALGDFESAHRASREALLLSRHREPLAVQIAVQHAATAAALRGRPARAARLRGYADAWCRRNGWERGPTERAGYDILERSLHEQLSAEQIATLVNEGASLEEDAALAEALQP